MATSIAERLVSRRFLADAFGGSMEVSRLVQNQPLLAGARELGSEPRRGTTGSRVPTSSGRTCTSDFQTLEDSQWA